MESEESARAQRREETSTVQQRVKGSSMSNLREHYAEGKEKTASPQKRGQSSKTRCGRLRLNWMQRDHKLEKRDGPGGQFFTNL